MTIKSAATSCSDEMLFQIAPRISHNSANYFTVHHVSTAAMEVQSLLVDWPKNNLRFQTRLLEALRPSHWKKVISRGSIEALPASLGFRANFGSGLATVNVHYLTTTTDTHNLPISIYSIDHDANRTNTPEVLQHKALVFRDIPTTTLVVQWNFEVNGNSFHGKATTLNGTYFGHCAYVLQHGARVSIEDIEEQTRQIAIAREAICSCNQNIQLLLDGSTYRLPRDGIIWSHRAANARPYWRTHGKTNVSRLRFERWLNALQTGQMTMEDEPDKLA